MMGGDSVDNFDANAGTNKLANVLSSRMQREPGNFRVISGKKI